jgi:glycosyltransferase involved in cell wall biosynthesis
MIILDSQDKSKWSFNNVKAQASFIFEKRSNAFALFNSPGEFKIRVLSRNLSGNGTFFVKIIEKSGSILLTKKINFSSKNWNENIIHINIPDKKNELKLLITRDLIGFGRIEIGRVTVEDLSKPILENNNIKKSFAENKLTLKAPIERVAVIVPYHIYGGAEVYLKNIFAYNPEGLNVEFLFLKNNKLLNYLKEYKSATLNNLNNLKHKLIMENYNKIVYYNSKNVYKILENLKNDGLITSELIEVYHSDFVWSDSLSSLKSRKNISKIIRINNDLANDISGKFELATVPVGINLDLYQKKDTPLSRIKNNLFKAYFGIVARLSDEKNISYAIDMFKRLKDYKLIIIGDGPLRANLQQQIALNKIQNVELLGHKENVFEYYNLFDAFILTSKIEGTPISIFEALAYNLPVFTTDVGKIKNSLEGLESVFYLSGILEKDIELLSNFDIKKEFFSREFVDKKYNAYVNSRKFFNELLGNNLSYSKYDSSLKVLSGEYI